MKTYQLLWRIICYRPWLFIGCVLIHNTIFPGTACLRPRGARLFQYFAN